MVMLHIKNISLYGFCSILDTFQDVENADTHRICDQYMPLFATESQSMTKMLCHILVEVGIIYNQIIYIL